MLTAEIDQYEDGVGRLALVVVAADDPGHQFWQDLMDASAEAEALAQFRLAFLTPQERQELSGYLELNWFEDPDTERRLSWLALYTDVRRNVRNLETENQCAEYDASQPLFVGAPALFAAVRRRAGSTKARLELIDESAMENVGGGAVYKVGQGYAKLARSLSPAVVLWGQQNFPNAPRYVRLDPFRYYKNAPPVMLTEAAIVPANPHWIRTMALHARETARYDLLEGVKEDMWDFLALGVRRLEMSATRGDDDYLSMMIEELPRPDADDGLMVGHCIHLDTDAKVGTPMEDAKLKHLDLAINVYRGHDRVQREAQTLQDGKAWDATYRTHLYRIENIPFASVFGFASMFFRSRVLFRQWAGDILNIKAFP